MKKSQLRNIIRESIKELMIEQSGNVFHRFQGMQMTGATMAGGTCQAGGIGTPYSPQLPGYVPGHNNINSPNFDPAIAAANNLLFYQFLGSPTTSGQFVQATITGGGPGMASTAPTPVCWKYLGTQSTPKVYSSGNIIAPIAPGSSGQLTNPLGPFNDCTTCYNATSQPVTTGCDPSAPFPPNFNLQSWTNTWTSLPNFSSSNPNQPCNFICQRRNQWQNQINAGGMGPKQTNMVACRLEEAENQYQIHNCATSNASNCP